MLNYHRKERIRADVEVYSHNWATRKLSWTNKLLLKDTRGEHQQWWCRQMGTKFVLSVLFGASVCANPPPSTIICGGQSKKPPFGKYQRRTRVTPRCRQMGIKFVLDVSLRRLQQCKSALTNYFSRCRLRLKTRKMASFRSHKDNPVMG